MAQAERKLLALVGAKTGAVEELPRDPRARDSYAFDGPHINVGILRGAVNRHQGNRG